jgi:hypothetical protein
MALSPALLARLAATGEPLADAVRHYAMAGVIERIARSPSRSALPLRGGMLTRLLVGPSLRRTRDLDFVGDFAFDVAATRERIAGALAIELADELAFAAPTATAMWETTRFPGVRAELAIRIGADAVRLQLDIGFGDPLVPPPRSLAFDGSTRAIEIAACAVEAQLAWKLHGLCELGDGWRPKDLDDAYLLATRVALDDGVLPAAIDAAFTSRGYTLAQARGLLDEPRWATKTARVRWGMRTPVLADVIAALRDRLGGVLASL